LRQPIGAGSYGEVWLARSVMGTPRAVKVVYRRRFDSGRPFEREFAGIQKYEPVSRSHDGLVDILQVGRHATDGYFYYVMELADDATAPATTTADSRATVSNRSTASYQPKTLASELARRGRLPFSECLSLFLSLTSALGHLHKHGLVHRDIKPSNVIFVNGVAKLADLGLVSEAGQSDSYVGTEGYIPPEGPGTQQADLYSLGKLCYEVSTGNDRTEFPTLPIELKELEANEELLELNAVLLKACANDPQHRYRSADEMHADLALLQSGQSVKRQRLIEHRLHHATRLGAVAAALLAILLAAYFLSERQRRVVRQNFEKAETQRLRAERAERDARDKEREATDKLWASYLAQARANRRTGQRGQRLDSLKAVAQAAAIRPAPELRQEAIAALALTDLRLLHTISPKGRVPLWLDFDPQLERCLTLPGAGEMRLYRPEANVTQKTNALEESRWTGILTGAVLSVVWSPDGRYVAVIGRDHRYQVWNLEERALTFEQPPESSAHQWAFAPDSRQLAVVYADQHIVFRSNQTGLTNQTLQLDAYPRHLTFDLEGGRFAMFHEPTNLVEIRSTATGTVLQRWSHPTPARDFAWSPRGNWLAVAGLDQNAYVWDWANERLVQTLRGHGSVLVHIKFLGSDDLLGTTAWDGTLRLWDALGGRQVLNVPGLAFYFDCNPLNHRVGFQGADAAHLSPFTPSRLQLYELYRSEVTRDLWEPRNPQMNGPWTVAFSPDERWLASGSDDGVRLWNVATGRQAAHLPGGLTLSVLFRLATNSLLTCSQSSLQEWPMGWVTDGEWSIGPPRPLAPTPENRKFVQAQLTPQGEAFATVEGGRIRGYRHGTNFLVINRTEGCYHLAASADGRWLAAGYAHRPNVGLFRTGATDLLRALPTAGPAQVAFTPDSRWLVTGSLEDYCFWDVTTGRAGLRIPREQDPGLSGRMAFSPDGRVMAVARSQWLVSLIDPADGKEYARLEHPDPQLISALAFSPSGTRLAVATEGHVIQVWDLLRLRQQLAALKLDWEQESFPDASNSPPAVPALNVILAPSSP
jgi:WD40 repeat protein